MHIERFVRVKFPQSFLLFFTLVFEVLFLGFYSDPCYLFGINTTSCYIFKKNYVRNCSTAV